MDVLVDFVGGWGLGDLLCADPMLTGLVERHGPATRLWLRGTTGNLVHHPHVAGLARDGQRFDRVVPVTLFTHMDHEAYGRFEALPSLVEHMCRYADVKPRDRRPRLHLSADELATAAQHDLGGRPRVVICADFVDPLRHWPAERWRLVAEVLENAGATVIGIGQQTKLGRGHDFVGRLSMRETAALLTRCDLFVGNNSGPFHYAQAAGLPCVTLFSLAEPSRFVHEGATVHPVLADGLPCLGCMTRCFTAMQKSGCIATPRGRCMTDIPVERVLDAIDRALARRFATTASSRC